MTPPLTILAIFAHPDDEIGVGSTLAFYSDKGVRTVLLCATRGEVATIFCDDCATRETLAQVRTGELECACAHIGIQELRWLDWPDGGVKDLPRAEAVSQIVRQIREIRPDVILTHPEHGLYPHPDHLAIWEMVRTAFSAAADPTDAAYSDAGPAWAPARLFTRALPQSIFEAAPGLKEFRVELNGELLPFYATPDNEVDVIMHVEPWVERRMAAWECHRSQHNPMGFSATMPDGVRRESAAHEHYILAAARVPMPDGVKDDLLAGLTPVIVEDDVLTAAAITAFRNELAAHRAIIEVCQIYLRTSPEPKQADLCRNLVDSEQEICHALARVLRLAGEPAGTITADERLRRRGQRLTRLADRIAFFRSTTEQALARCQAQAAASPLAVWKDLDVLLQAQAATVLGFTD